MDEKYLDYFKLVRNFLNNQIDKKFFLFIRLLSPIRKDIDYKFIKNIFFKKNNFNFFRINLYLYFKNIANFSIIFIEKTYDLITSFGLPKTNLYFKKNQQFDTALLTHCNNEDQIIGKIDFYYGLDKKKTSSNFLVLNKTGIKGKKLAKLLSKSKPKNCFFINPTGNLLDLLVSFLIASKAHLVLLLKWIIKPKNRILLVASIDSISKESLTNLIIFNNVKRFLHQFNIKKLVITWEGHAWERYIANYCNNNSIALYGYIHAGPFKYQLSAHRFLGSEFEPKSLLSTNQISKKLLKKYYSKDSIVIGSNKANLISNNKNKLNLFNSQRQHIKKTLLVIPQGTFEEVKELLLIALNSLDKDLKIIIRLHPALRNNKKLNHFIENKIKKYSTHEKIILSKQTIEEDILHATHFLYSSSTAALECLSFGLTPIHFNSGGEMNSLDGYNLPNKFEAFNIDDVKRILNYKISKIHIENIINFHTVAFDIDYINKK